MCGQVNKKMSVQETVEDLTQECIQLRRNLLSISDQKEREKIVLNHIKERARADIRVSDFQKGYHELTFFSFYSSTLLCTCNVIHA